MIYFCYNHLSTAKNQMQALFVLLINMLKLSLTLTANASVATVLGSIPASVGTVESEGRQMKQC
jgi:hypothetical protein